MDKQKYRHKLKFQILIGIIIFFVILTIVQAIFGIGGISSFLDSIKDTKLFVASYILLFIVSSFFPIPFLTLFGATIFPFWEGFVYSMIGHVISFTVLFYFARWLGKDYLDYYVSRKPKLKKLKIDLEKRSFFNIILLRFFYLIPPEFVCILGGISNMSFSKYALASFIGMVPVTFGSIMLAKSSIENNLNGIIISSIFLTLLILIPLFFIPKLRSIIKRDLKRKK